MTQRRELTPAEKYALVKNIAKHTIFKPDTNLINLKANKDFQRIVNEEIQEKFSRHFASDYREIEEQFLDDPTHLAKINWTKMLRETVQKKYDRFSSLEHSIIYRIKERVSITFAEINTSNISVDKCDTDRISILNHLSRNNYQNILREFYNKKITELTQNGNNVTDTEEFSLAIKYNQADIISKHLAYYQNKTATITANEIIDNIIATIKNGNIDASLELADLYIENKYTPALSTAFLNKLCDLDDYHRVTPKSLLRKKINAILAISGINPFIEKIYENFTAQYDKNNSDDCKEALLQAIIFQMPTEIINPLIVHIVAKFPNHISYLLSLADAVNYGATPEIINELLLAGADLNETLPSNILNRLPTSLIMILNNKNGIMIPDLLPKELIESHKMGAIRLLAKLGSRIDIGDHTIFYFDGFIKEGLEIPEIRKEVAFIKAKKKNPKLGIKNYFIFKTNIKINPKLDINDINSFLVIDRKSVNKIPGKEQFNLLNKFYLAEESLPQKNLAKEIIHAMVEGSFNINAKNDSGKTLLDLAFEKAVVSQQGLDETYHSFHSSLEWPTFLIGEGATSHLAEQQKNSLLVRLQHIYALEKEKRSRALLEFRVSSIGIPYAIVLLSVLSLPIFTPIIASLFVLGNNLDMSAIGGYLPAGAFFGTMPATFFSGLSLWLLQTYPKFDSLISSITTLPIPYLFKHGSNHLEYLYAKTKLTLLLPSYEEVEPSSQPNVSCTARMMTTLKECICPATHDNIAYDAVPVQNGEEDIEQGLNRHHNLQYGTFDHSASAVNVVEEDQSLVQASTKKLGNM